MRPTSVRGVLFSPSFLKDGEKWFRVERKCRTEEVSWKELM